MDELIICVKRMLDKIEIMFSSIWGWIIALCASFVNFLGGEKYAFAAVGVAILIDLIWGIIVALKRGKFLKSYLMRATFPKVAGYGSGLLTILMIERIFQFDWFIATKVACGIAVACEFISFSANILIIFPNFPFFRIFSKFLQGEIGSKLKIQDTEKFFNNENKQQL